jgi:hypothetical protein
MADNLYELLEGLISARYSNNKLPILEKLNTQLDISRYQSRLLLDLQLIQTERYAHAAKLLTEIGKELGGWTKQQKNSTKEISKTESTHVDEFRLRSTLD